MFFQHISYFYSLTNLQLLLNLSPSLIKVNKKASKPPLSSPYPTPLLLFLLVLLLCCIPLRSTVSIAEILHCVTRYGGESQPQPHATIYCSFIKCDIGSSNSLGHFMPNWTQTTPNQSGSEASRERRRRCNKIVTQK